MSALANDNLAAESEAMAIAQPFSGSSEDMHMSARFAALRDTILVVGVQMVFRATLVFAALELLAAVSSIKFARPNASTPRPRPAPPGLGFFFALLT